MISYIFVFITVLGKFMCPSSAFMKSVVEVFPQNQNFIPTIVKNTNRVMLFCVYGPKTDVCVYIQKYSKFLSYDSDYQWEYTDENEIWKTSKEYIMIAFHHSREGRRDWIGNKVRRPRGLSGFSNNKKGTLKYAPSGIVFRYEQRRQKNINVVMEVDASVFFWYKQKTQTIRNTFLEIGRGLHEQIIFQKSFLKNISQLCALPWDFYCICERHHFRSLRRHCKYSDTNICHPTAYQCYHSVPRSFIRLRAV